MPTPKPVTTPDWIAMTREGRVAHGKQPPARVDTKTGIRTAWLAMTRPNGERWWGAMETLPCGHINDLTLFDSGRKPLRKPGVCPKGCA